METDICIVGGGVMGLAAAYSLSRMSNLQVLLLDRYGVGNEYCSSKDVNRVFRYAYGGDSLYTQMAAESLELWRDLERESDQDLLIRSGLLLLEGEDEDRNRFNEASYKTLTSMGLGAEVLEGPELKKRFPQFSAAKAFLDPHGGVLLASKALAALSSIAKRQQVRILEEYRVTALHLNRHPAVEISQGERVQCRKVIVTIGPWSNSLLRNGLTKVTPTRQQLIYLRPRTGLDQFQPGSFPVFFADQYYGIPATGVDGVKVSHMGKWDPVDPDRGNRLVDPEAVEACRSLCRRFIPELAGGELVHSKVCLYDMTGNSDFVISPDPEYPSIIYGYGFSGHGFKFAPLVGKLLAELALGEPASFELTRFAAVR